MTETLRPSRTKRWLAALCASLMLVPPGLSPAVAQNRLPALGDLASEDLSVGSERRLGEQIMRQIRPDPAYLDDPVLLDYLQSIWQPLLEAARQRGDIADDLEQGFAWEAFLVRDRSVNAFALPGGFVGVHLGLIAMTATRDELASVLAHELTHVTQRHIARGMAISQRQSLIGLAAMILGAVAASRSNRGDGANAIFTGGQAMAMQGQLNFSRDMEREADRIGFGVLSSAGFSPGGMAAMFEKLEQSSRLNDSGGYPYLRSHPLNAERIGEARSRLGTAAPVAPASLLTHAAGQARAKVMMDPRTDALRRLQPLSTPAGASDADALGAAYASALASTLLRDWDRAEASLQVAAGIVRRNGQAEREVAMLQAQLLLARGDAAAAAQALKPYAKVDVAASSRPVMLLSARIAMALDKAALERSAQEMQTWTALHPNDALAWSQLAQAWQQLGFGLRALRAEAESRIAVGDLTGGVDRLRAAQQMARKMPAVDFMDASVIDARLRVVEGQARQRELEEPRQQG